MPDLSGSLPFDIVFTDTCVGGSTVASELARTRKGLRAFFLADYAVNPLGVKSDEAVREALDRWVDAAGGPVPRPFPRMGVGEGGGALICLSAIL